MMATYHHSGTGVQRLCVMLILFGLLAACDLVGAPPPEPTITPTRALSGATLEPSPTVAVQSVDQLSDNFTVGQNDLTAASVPSGGSLPPISVSSEPGSLAQRVQMVSETGTLLYADLYESGSARLPGMLLLGADYGIWSDFPVRLQSAGFTVMVLPVTISTTSADVRAVLRALSEDGAVNPGSIGVIGTELGADLALLGCALEALCDAVALLTPVEGNTLLNIIADYNPRPLFVAVSQNDPTAYGIAQALQQLATGEMVLQSYDNAGRGTALFQAQPPLADLLIEWLRTHLGSE